MTKTTATEVLIDVFSTVLPMNTHTPKGTEVEQVRQQLQHIADFIAAGGKHGERLLTVQSILKKHEKKMASQRPSDLKTQCRRAYAWSIANLQIELMQCLDAWGVPPQLEKVVFDYECGAEGVVGGA